MERSELAKPKTTSKCVKRCYVQFCSSTYTSQYKDKSNSVFALPFQRGKQWVEWLRLTGDEELLDLPFDKLRSKVKICVNHFKPDEVLVGTGEKGRTRPKPGVVPSIFPVKHVPLSEIAIAKWLNENPGILVEAGKLNRKRTASDSVAPRAKQQVSDCHDEDPEVLQHSEKGHRNGYAGAGNGVEVEKECGEVRCLLQQSLKNIGPSNMTGDANGSGEAPFLKRLPLGAVIIEDVCEDVGLPVSIDSASDDNQDKDHRAILDSLEELSVSASLSLLNKSHHRPLSVPGTARPEPSLPFSTSILPDLPENSSASPQVQPSHEEVLAVPLANATPRQSVVDQGAGRTESVAPPPSSLSDDHAHVHHTPSSGSELPRMEADCDDVLALPLASATPKRAVVETSFKVNKRPATHRRDSERNAPLVTPAPVHSKTESSSHIPKRTSKRSRPSVAKIRSTKRQILEEVGGGHAEVTPLKKELCKKLMDTRAKLELIKKENDHLKGLQKVENIPGLLEDVISVGLQALLASNIKNHTRPPKGKRWNVEDKRLALSIFKRSPKAYRMLCNLLALPSIRTLQRTLETVPLAPGVGYDIIKYLGSNVNKMKKGDECVILMFDELFIKKRYLYNDKTGQIEGFVDYGKHTQYSGLFQHSREGECAEHALVFKVQGLKRRFKQPIGYHFVGKTVSSEKLRELIIEYITALQDQGLKVMATVCDQGATNRGALSLLMAGTDGGKGLEEGYFSVAGQVVLPLYDVPHLFKSLRNNFMSAHEVSWDNKTAKYAHVLQALRADNGIFRMKRITDTQARPQGKMKMKVKYAVKLLSRTTSCMMSTLARSFTRSGRRMLMLAATKTACVIRDWDRLWDLSNGPAGPSDAKFGKDRKNVSATSGHIPKWREMARKIDEMEFKRIEKPKKGQNTQEQTAQENTQEETPQLQSQKQAPQLKTFRPPCQDGWVFTLKNMEKLWVSLRDNHGFKYLNLRQLNQDPLENLFGIIRQHGATSDNPTCGHFTAALKTAIITNLTSYKSTGFNAEKDDGKLFSNLEHFLDDCSKEPQVAIQEEPINVENLIQDLQEEPRDCHPAEPESQTEDFWGEDLGANIINACAAFDEEEDSVPGVELPDIDKSAPTYVTGYILKRIEKKWAGCQDCRNILTASTLGPEHDFTQEKEYNPRNPSLHYPATSIAHVVHYMHRNFEKMFDDQIHVSGLQHLVNTKLHVLFDCSKLSCGNAEHSKNITDSFFPLLTRMLLHTYCKRKSEAFQEEEAALKKAREAVLAAKSRCKRLNEEAKKAEAAQQGSTTSGWDVKLMEAEKEVNAARETEKTILKKKRQLTQEEKRKAKILRMESDPAYKAAEDVKRAAATLKRKKTLEKKKLEKRENFQQKDDQTEALKLAKAQRKKEKEEIKQKEEQLKNAACTPAEIKEHQSKRRSAVMSRTLAPRNRTGGPESWHKTSQQKDGQREVPKLPDAQRKKNVQKIEQKEEQLKNAASTPSEIKQLQTKNQSAAMSKTSTPTNRIGGPESWDDGEIYV